MTVDATQDALGAVTLTEKSTVYKAKFVAIASGHHAKPVWPDFPGMDTFKGEGRNLITYVLKVHLNYLQITCADIVCS